MHDRVWDNPNVAATLAATARSMMGSKDKAGRNTKTVAAKDLKAKRLDKKAKRSAADAKRNRAG